LPSSLQRLIFGYASRQELEGVPGDLRQICWRGLSIDILGV